MPFLDVPVSLVSVDVGPPTAAWKVGQQLLREWDGMTGEERNRALRVIVREVRLRRGTRWREPVADRLEVLFVG